MNGTDIPISLKTLAGFQPMGFCGAMRLLRGIKEDINTQEVRTDRGVNVTCEVSDYVLFCFRKSES